MRIRLSVYWISVRMDQPKAPYTEASRTAILNSCPLTNRHRQQWKVRRKPGKEIFALHFKSVSNRQSNGWHFPRKWYNSWLQQRISDDSHDVTIARTQQPCNYSQSSEMYFIWVSDKNSRISNFADICFCWCLVTFYDLWHLSQSGPSTQYHGMAVLGMPPN